MKLVLVIILLVAALVRVDAQESIGFSPGKGLGPSIKLDGIVIYKESGGYLVLSVPPKDIERFIYFFAKMEPHVAILVALERLENESRKLVPVAGSPKVPIGTCFLVTDEIFPHHKIIDRNVQSLVPSAI